MQQIQASRFAQGGALSKMLGALVAFMVLLALAPMAPGMAYADDPALSVGIAAGTHQGNGKTTFDLLTGNSKTMYVQVQNASMGDKALVQDGFRVAAEGDDANEADFAEFAIKWYKDSVSDENLLKTSYLGWNSYYGRPQWSTDLYYSPDAPEAAGTYKYYAVATWELEGYQAAASEPLEFTFNVTDPVVSDITAVASPQEGGTVAFKVGGQEVTQAKTGDEVTVVATPAEGYTLGEVSVKDAEGADVSYSSYWESFDMPASAATVTVTFLKVTTSEIQTAASEHGTVVYTVGGQEVTQAKTGDTVRISVTPDYGYVRDSVSAVDAEGNEVAISRNSFTMPSSKVSVTVTYAELPKYDVVKSADIDTATGDISFDKTQFVSGDTINVTITPAEGYELDTFTLTDPEGNDVPNSKWGDFGLYSQLAADGLSATIKIQDYWHLEGGGQNTNLVVGATFKIAPTRYDIQLAELGEGVSGVTFRVDGSEAVKAAGGDVVTIYPVIDYGFDLDAVTVTDESGQPVQTTLGANWENGGKYYFTMPAGKVTVAVTAAAPSYSVVVDEDIQNGTITLAEGNSATFTAADLSEGDYTVKFDIVPDPGYKFDEDSFSVVDESGWEVSFWDGVSWDAAAGTVSFDEYVLDGNTRTFTVKGEFVSKSVDDVIAEIEALDAENPDADAVAVARADFDALSAEDQELVGTDNELKLLKVQAVVAEAKIAELEEAKADLEQQLQDAEAENDDLAAAKAEAEGQLEQVNAELETAKGDLAKANEALETAASELEKAKGELAGKDAELTQAKDDLAKATEELGKAQAAAAGAESAAKDLETANGKIASLESQLAAAKTAGKAANPMTVKAKPVKAKKAKKTTVAVKKAFAVKNAKGKLTYAKLSGNDKITVKANGKIVVKKGLKKKTYKVKVLVVAAGDKIYAPATKTVTLKVKVK